MRIASGPRRQRVQYLEQFATDDASVRVLASLRSLYDPIGLAAKPLFLEMIKETLRDLPDDTFSETILYDTYINKSLRTKWELLADPGDELTSDELIENLKEILEDVAVRLQETNGAYLYLRDYQDNDRGKIAERLWKMRDQPVPREPFPLAAQDDAANRVGIRSLLKAVPAPDAERWPVDFFHRSMREYFVARSIVRSLTTDERRARQILSAAPLLPEIAHFAATILRSRQDDAALVALEKLARSATTDRRRRLYRRQRLHPAARRGRSPGGAGLVRAVLGPRPTARCRPAGDAVRRKLAPVCQPRQRQPAGRRPDRGRPRGGPPRGDQPGARGHGPERQPGHRRVRRPVAAQVAQASRGQAGNPRWSPRWTTRRTSYRSPRWAGCWPPARACSACSTWLVDADGSGDSAEVGGSGGSSRAGEASTIRCAFRTSSRCRAAVLGARTALFTEEGDSGQLLVTWLDMINARVLDELDVDETVTAWTQLDDVLFAFATPNTVHVVSLLGGRRLQSDNRR